jgi:hypothetical protein
MQTSQPTKASPHHLIKSSQSMLLNPRRVTAHAVHQTYEAGTASQQPQANLTVFQGSQRFQQPIGLLSSASSVGVTEGRIADRCTKEFKVVENSGRTIRVTQQSSRKMRSKVCRTKATNCNCLTLSQVEHQAHAGGLLLDVG